MPELTTFTSDKENIFELLKEIKKGEIQLPEFQRGWIWDDDRIKSLLASVSQSYPIGALMLLENGSADVRFKPRPIEGVKLSRNIDPDRFILDGQQRMTSLYQALFMHKAVETIDSKKHKIKRWYYIDMLKALNPEQDREEAIISLPEDKKIKNFRGEIQDDYSSDDAEYENMLFPCSCLFDSAEWRNKYGEHWDYDKEKIRLFDQFERDVIKRFEQYLVPVIKLLNGTPKEAVCQVFEKVNTGGVSLTVFELLTATFAADEFDLREDWQQRKKKLSDVNRLGTVAKILSGVQSDEFLQAITLLTTYNRRIKAIKEGKAKDQLPGISCKRKDILKLTLEEYKNHAGQILNGFIKAGKLLFSQKIFRGKDLPYNTQLVPLAAILTVLNDKSDLATNKEKILKWYWNGVFGELYGSATETRFALDIYDVLEWVDGGSEPRTIQDANFYINRLYTLQTRNSAAYKGVYALLIRDGCRDFRSGTTIDDQTYFDDKIDIHHIFPRDWCTTRKLDKNKWNSIVNKTPLSAKTNRIIGHKAPSVYLSRITKSQKLTHTEMNEIIKTHVINPAHLWNDDFDAFFTERMTELKKRIENVMGKEVIVSGVEEFDVVDEEEDESDQ